MAAATEQARFEARMLERWHKKHGREVKVTATSANDLQCEVIGADGKKWRWTIGIEDRTHTEDHATDAETSDRAVAVEAPTRHVPPPGARDLQRRKVNYAQMELFR